MDNKIKKYILRIIWDMNEDELLHLSEEFNDLDTIKVKFEVDGKDIEIPKEMLKYLNKYDETLGLT
jgi:hypothetical protein